MAYFLGEVKIQLKDPNVWVLCNKCIYLCGILQKHCHLPMLRRSWRGETTKMRGMRAV